MNKQILFNSTSDDFPPLSFWEMLPTKSIVHFKDKETNTMEQEIFSHVATGTVYFTDNNNFVFQQFSYDTDAVVLPYYEIDKFPIQIDLSEKEILHYDFVPSIHFNKIVDQFKAGKIKLYNDYMDQGWGEVEIEHADYLYVEEGNNFVSYIGGENLWILHEDLYPDI